MKMTNNNITIIIPICTFTKGVDDILLTEAIRSVNNNSETYDGELSVIILAPTDTYEDVLNFINENSNQIGTGAKEISVIENKGDADFCSQINFGVNYVNDDFFSILEYDDTYADNWFKMANDYFYGNEDVSLFLPINVQYNSTKTKWQFGNELVWASSFSNELGFIDFDSLQNCSVFNITGGIFNKKDFVKIGGLKPSIKIAFNYEFLLRMTYNNLKVFVVPKEGYMHVIGRKFSLTDMYNHTITDEETEKWFELAMREYQYKEDRKKGIKMLKENLK